MRKNGGGVERTEGGRSKEDARVGEGKGVGGGGRGQGERRGRSRDGEKGMERDEVREEGNGGGGVER